MGRQTYFFPNRHNARQRPSKTVQSMLREAVTHHQAGRLVEAERIYRQILAIDARHSDSLNLLGMIAYAGGRYELAIETIHKAILISPKQPSYYSHLGLVFQAQNKLREASSAYQRALTLNPNLTEAHINLGTVFQAQGNLTGAVACYQRALALKPDSSEALANLGTTLQSQGNFDEAVACYQRALVLKPNCAEICYNLANVLQSQGKLEEAVALLKQAVALNPNFADAYTNLGINLHALGRLDEAVACYRHALAIKPNYPEAHGNLAIVLHEQGKLQESIARHEQALALNPALAASHYNLGNALQSQDKLDDAIACYSRALALQPDYAEAQYNWGCALYAKGNVDAALARYRSAIALNPDYAQAHFSESLAQLLKADFVSGWRNYEWRWRTKEHDTRMRSYPQPLWTGRKLSRRLLIWGEQGIGDEIMFAGLIPEVLGTGNRCILDCDPRLKPLFSRSFPAVEVVSSPAPDHPLEDFEAHLPCGSLPALFRSTEAAFSATTSPYLVPDLHARDHFRANYADGRCLIGLAWYTKNRKTGRNRSIDLSLLAPLFAHPGIRWVSLQYGDPATLEAEAARAKACLLIDRSVNQFADMDRFAAQVAAMDLVVTIDNSTAHLAGALAVPTWLLLPFAPDWRWRETREESPWYPSLRIFRQTKLSDWSTVIQNVRAAL
jgi:tetratricopeptide (TPR) repeat protein